MAIDKNGNKWMASYNGLYKFDGTDWIIYNSSNSGLSYKYLEIGKCLSDEKNETESPAAVESPKPIETQQPLPKKSPAELPPEEEEEPASMFWQVVVFLIIGFILTGGIVAGYFFYQKEKNNNRYLLKGRIIALKWRKAVIKFGKEYWKKLKEFLGFRK